MKKTVVIGASENPLRYSFLAVEKLKKYGHPVVAVGAKPGHIGNTEILAGQPFIEDVDTITLYINPSLQTQMESYIFSLKPKRILFNPGTENPDLEKKAGSLGIKTKEACTLVLLGTGQF
jgi:predicted CoA-binding protein